jgi:hypothetical protein
VVRVLLIKVMQVVMVIQLALQVMVQAEAVVAQAQ